MRLILENIGERNTRIYNRPVSALKIDDKKINYYSYISSMENEDLNNALLRIVPRINEDAVKKLVDATPVLSDLQKDFYKTMLIQRKQIILDETYKKILENAEEKKY